MPASASVFSDDQRFRIRQWLIAVALLVLCFAKPLYQWVRFALGSELYSHMVLIPFVSIYLVKIRDNRLVNSPSPSFLAAAIPVLVGIASLIFFWWKIRSISPLAKADAICLLMLSFVTFFWGIYLCFFGTERARSILFPLAFLIFMVPFPVFVENGIEIFFQHTSAWAANVLFVTARTPVLHEGLSFFLPGIKIAVAAECSGIHSSLALFITSLVAGQMLLTTNIRRAVLALFVIPLAIVRNGFRIFVIGELCVHIGPEMIDSFIHHKGGPIFFLLSLIPFFILLLFLRKTESRRKTFSSIPNPKS